MCLITTNPADLPMFGVVVHPTAENGLKATSRLLVEKVTTVSKSRLVSSDVPDPERSHWNQVGVGSEPDRPLNSRGKGIRLQCSAPRSSTRRSGASPGATVTLEKSARPSKLLR